MSEVVYVVDVFSLLFQVFHAIPPMSSPTGQPTNALFGFTRDMITILRDRRPEYLICAMDSVGPAVRNEVYADYKAHRPEMPDDLQPQLPLLGEILAAFDVARISHDGWEADDVIATVARQATARGLDVVVVTSDKDIRQLISPQVRILNMRKAAFFDEPALREAWGIRPDQVVDFQALVGDSVDNVPGVPLVGPKKAAALLNEFGTLEEVLSHADQAPGAKLRENLKTYAEQARTSRRLVELNGELPLEIDWEAVRAHRPDVARLRTLCRQLGFRRFADEIQALYPKQRELFEPRLERTCEIVDSADRFAQFLDELKLHKRFALDLETTSLDATRAEICGWAISWESGTGFYLPIRCPETDRQLNGAAVLAALKPLLVDPGLELVNQNIKYDLIVLLMHGVQITGIGIDPMVGDYLLDAGARSHGLDQLAEKYLRHRMIPISDLIGSGKKQKCISSAPVQQVAEYAVEDADVALRLGERIETELKQQNLWALYWDLERPLIPVLAEMEAVGIRVDVEELRRQSRELALQLKATIEEIYQLAGREFNIDSPIQLRVVLFDEQGLPVLKRTKTGPSTDQDVLERLAALHELPAKIMQHRRLSKLKGTYLDALPELVNPATGRIHCSFNQVVAATGRLSSSEPNLQNIPIRTPEGRQIRRAFLPAGPDWKLLCGDYSQIELRMLAHFSRDPELVAAFEAGIDIHAAVAAQVFGVPLESVDGDQRRVAKAVNFGVIYGQTPFGLAAALGISKEEAARFIDDYFARYAGVARFIETLLDDVARSGYATTLRGRRRAIEGVRRIRRRNLSLPERTAINTVIQGSAADLIKQAMLNVRGRLAREGLAGLLLLQIHDELVLETPLEELPATATLVRREMESAIKLSVPLVVDLVAGDNWHDVEAL